MASLIIEDVPEKLLESIEERARAHGRSLEEEVKRLLDERYRKRRKVLDSRLVSCDDALVRAFPDIVFRPSDVVGGQ